MDSRIPCRDCRELEKRVRELEKTVGTLKNEINVLKNTVVKIEEFLQPDPEVQGEQTRFCVLEGAYR